MKFKLGDKVKMKKGYPQEVSKNRILGTVEYMYLDNSLVHEMNSIQMYTVYFENGETIELTEWEIET